MFKHIAAGMLLAFVVGCAHAPQTSEVQPNRAGLVQSANQPDARVEGMLSIGKAQYEQGRLQAAERTLQMVLDLEPHNQPALYYLGLIARQTWLEAHPGRRRAAQPPEHLPAPTPCVRSL